MFPVMREIGFIDLLEARVPLRQIFLQKSSRIGIMSKFRC